MDSGLGRIEQDDMETIRIRDFFESESRPMRFQQRINVKKFNLFLEGVSDVPQFLAKCSNSEYFPDNYVAVVRLIAHAIRRKLLTNVDHVDRFNSLSEHVRLSNVKFDDTSFIYSMRDNDKGYGWWGRKYHVAWCYQ